MPFSFPGEKIPSSEDEVAPPTSVNLIDDIVNKGKSLGPGLDGSSRNVSCRDQSERNELMMSSALSASDIDFEITNLGVKSLSDMKLGL